MENTLYPLKFTPILKDKIWGGSRLKKTLNKDTKSSKCGESWELSGVAGDVSVVANGFLQDNSLDELIEIYMDELVGEQVYERFGNEFPLLIKFIDANDDLSIQVHPNDALAAERHDSFGKTEMWYIMEADKDAELITGFKKSIDKATYLKHLNNNSLKDILNSEKVKEGDTFFIPAGRVHAIGKGILLAEIQQTSDITYRIYDWGRTDEKGNPRDLHTEQAVDAIDYKAYEQYKTQYQTELNETKSLVKCDYFNTNVLEFDTTIIKDYNYLDSFVIYICTYGSVMIIFDPSQSPVEIHRGETVLIPAAVRDVVLQPREKSRLLEVYIK